MDYQLWNFTRADAERVIKSNTTLYCLVFLCALKIFTVIASIHFPHNIFFADVTRIHLEQLVNQARVSANLSPLERNDKLQQAAELKAQDMIKNQYFAHTSPTGVEPWHWFSQAGYKYRYAGENLAVGFFDSTDVFNAWLASPGHRDNIMNSHYQQVGTAVLSGFGSESTIVVVQLFGSELPVAVQAQPAQPVAQKPAPIEPTPRPLPGTPSFEAPGVLAESSGFQAPGPLFALPKLSSQGLVAYGQFLQDILYGVGLIGIGLLFSLIVFMAKVNQPLQPQLVFRSLLLAVILSFSLFINVGLVSLVIPHQIII